MNTPNGPVLKYYKSESDAAPYNVNREKGVISLVNATVGVDEEPRKEKAKRPVECMFSIGPTFRDYERTYYLCADDVDEKARWVETLSRIFLLYEEQKHFRPTRKGGKGGKEDKDIAEDEEDTIKYDLAQNWTAYGRGISGGKMDGKPVSFTVQANNMFGEVDIDARLFNAEDEPDGYKLSVVVESNELHLDADIKDNWDGTFTASFCVPCVGTYELSVMLDGYDIYGSPFFPKIEPANVSSQQCTAEGPGLVCAVLGEPNEFTICPKSYFGEILGPDGPALEFLVTMEEPLKLESITRNDDDGTYKVVYTVEGTAEQLEEKRQQAALREGFVGANQLTAEIQVRLDDSSMEKLGIARRIKNSPFCPVITESSSSEDFAAAFEASAFLKILQEREYDTDGDETLASLRTKLSNFAKMVRQPQLLADQKMVPVQENKLKTEAGDPHVPGQTNEAAPRLERFVGDSNGMSSPVQQSAQAPPPHYQQQQDQQYHGSAYLPVGGPAYTSNFLQFPPSNQSAYMQQPQQAQGQRQEQQQWSPQGHEASMVRESLQERAYDIEREKQDLVRKRQELDESRLLIDEQVRRMAEIGRKVHADSERVVQEARDLKQQQQQLLPAKENSASNSPYSSPAHSRGGQTPKKPAASAASNGGWLVLDEPLVALFDKNAVVLSRVFEYYRSSNGTGVVQLSDIIRLAQNYDFTPTMISRKEIRELYDDVAGRSADSVQSLSYEGFIEVLAKIAVYSVSKPMFAHLYKTNIAKVNVLLTTWRVADPVKLSEIQEADLKYGF